MIPWIFFILSLQNLKAAGTYAYSIVTSALHGEVIPGATLRPLISQMAHEELAWRYQKGIKDFQTDIQRHASPLQTAEKPLREYEGDQDGYKRLEAHLSVHIERERMEAQRLIRISYRQLPFHYPGIENYRPFCELAFHWLQIPIPHTACEGSLTDALRSVQKSLNIIPEGDNFKKFR